MLDNQQRLVRGEEERQQQAPAVRLTDRWELHTAQGVAQAMQQVIPGAWLLVALGAVAECVRSPPAVPKLRSEQHVEAQANMLGEALQFAAFLGAVEVQPMAGNPPSSVVLALHAVGVKVGQLSWRTSPLEARVYTCGGSVWGCLMCWWIPHRCRMCFCHWFCSL